MLPRHSVSVVGAVMRSDGRALVAERADGTRWEPPGGVLEFHETLEEGVKREVFEETGYHIELERLASIQKNISAGIMVFTYRAHVIGGDLTPSPETPRVEWWSIEQVTQDIPELYAYRILDALTTECPIRYHDGERILGNTP